jgi:hypothetical protein
MSRLILANSDYEDFDTTAGADSTTLSAIIGKQYIIKNSGTGGNPLTVNYGASLLNLEDGQAFYFIFDGTLWSTLSGQGGAGASITGELGEAVTAGDALYFATDGKLYIADNTDPTKVILAGLSLSTASSSETIIAQKAGLIDFYSGLTVGTAYYLGATGNLIEESTISGGAETVFIGVAVSTSAIDANIQLPSAGGGGSITEGTLGETVAQAKLTYFKTDGKMYLADNTDFTKSFCVGFTLTAGILDDEVEAQKAGSVDLFTGLTIGSDYYLGTAGDILLKSQLADGAQIVYVGRAVSTTEMDANVQPPQPVVRTGDFDEIGTIKYFSTYKDRPSLLPFAFDNAISQGTYSPLFAEVGHMFNDAHVAAGDADLSGSGTLFYPTPPPDAYGRIGIPTQEFTDLDVDISLDRATGLTGIVNALRDGTAFRFELISGTVPTGLTDGTIYYGRFGDGFMDFYPTEEDAIAITNRVDITTTGSGTFRLTQEGISIDDAVEDHNHGASLDNSGVGGVGGALVRGVTKDTESSDGTFVTGVNGANISNETRPNTFYEFAYIKAESITPSGEAVSALRYVEDWQTCPQLGNDVVINHKLGMLLDDGLQVIVLGRDAGGIISIPFHFRSDVNVNYGLIPTDVDINNILIQSGDASSQRILDNSGLLSIIIDIKVVVTKPNLVSTFYNTNNRQVYDIADAVDVTYNLPDASNTLDEIVVKRRGAGTGKVLFNTQSAQTIDGNIPSTYELENAVKDIFVVFPSGGNWFIKIYSLIV